MGGNSIISRGNALDFTTKSIEANPTTSYARASSGDVTRTLRDAYVSPRRSPWVKASIGLMAVTMAAGMMILGAPIAAAVITGFLIAASFSAYQSSEALDDERNQFIESMNDKIEGLEIEKDRCIYHDKRLNHQYDQLFKKREEATSLDKKISCEHQMKSLENSIRENRSYYKEIDSKIAQLQQEIKDFTDE